MVFKRLFFALFLLSFLHFHATSQDENLRYEDWVYVDYVKSVRLHAEGLFLSYPIIDLNANVPLEFSFDDIDGDFINYVYTIELCNQDWTPVNLDQTEYIEGFLEDDIDEFDYSFQTETLYTHYTLLLPNEDMGFKKSGNYLLKVYDNEEEKTLVVTRRFMVVEPIMRVESKMTRPAKVSLSQTHQELDFKVLHDDINIRNPRTELRATVLQNGRWDNAVTDIAPIFTRQQEQVFDYQDKIVFPAGKEWRYADLRSFKMRTEGIKAVHQFEDHFEVTLQQDKKRLNQAYLDWNDLNGNYVIETFDNDVPSVESEYAYVLFSLYSPSEIYDSKVYIYGALTDWALKPEFEMKYNPAINSYVAKPYLKQGFYNYAYAVVLNGTDEMDFEETEGNWFETENLYTILIYYRPFGARHDRLVSAFSFGSR